MDSVTPERRSEIMGLVKCADTRPEIAIRRILHRLGYRFRLREKGLPGKPDVVLPRWRTVILVHGCFWHRHPGCPNTRTPKSRVDFWTRKFDENVERDRQVQSLLEALGWRVCTVWECELSDTDRLVARLNTFIKAVPDEIAGTIQRSRGTCVGTAMAGFEHEAVIELDHDSCETLRLNKQRNVPPVTEWEVIEADIRHFDYAPFGDAIGFIAGGVPCQPFSLGGKHRGHEDARDMFPEFIRAVDALKPRAFLVENVKGLLRQNFADYFEYIILRLSHPMIEARKSQTWRDHRAELERIHTAGKPTKLDYNVVFQLLNAADFGVPQRRERVFIVGFRSDLGVRWSFPAPTHSREALLRSMWVDGDYWEHHCVPARSRPKPDKQLARSIADLRGKRLWDDDARRWRTVRDAISGLRTLRPGETDPDDPNHFLNPGARSYKGHTGSLWDEPAKTLKAGDHGVPGGENTLAIGGETRYFSPRKCAPYPDLPRRIPDHGIVDRADAQMGNAVPVTLAEVVSRDIHAHLTGR